MTMSTWQCGIKYISDQISNLVEFPIGSTTQSSCLRKVALVTCWSHLSSCCIPQINEWLCTLNFRTICLSRVISVLPLPGGELEWHWSIESQKCALTTFNFLNVSWVPGATLTFKEFILAKYVTRRFQLISSKFELVLSIWKFLAKIRILYPKGLC